MFLIKENEVYKIEREFEYSLKEKITFKQPTPKFYQKHEYDWYMTVALEKTDKITEDRHLLTYELIVAYRWAIREGYNHELDKTLRKPYDYPRNRNTVRGVQMYVDRITKAHDARMDSILSDS